MNNNSIFNPIFLKAWILLASMLLVFPFDGIGQKRELKRLKKGLVQKYSYQTNSLIAFDRVYSYLGQDTMKRSTAIWLFPAVLSRLTSHCSFRKVVVKHESSNPTIYILYSLDTIKIFSSGRLKLEGKGSDYLQYLAGNISGNPFCQPKRFFAGIAKGTIQNSGKRGSDTLIVQYVHQDRLLKEEVEYVVTLSDTLLISYTSRLFLRKGDMLFRTNEIHYYSVKKELPDISFESMAEKIIQKHQGLIDEKQQHDELKPVFQADPLHMDLPETVYPEGGDSILSSSQEISSVGIDFSQYVLVNLEGDTFALEPSDSTYTLLYFWYFGCPPCHRAIPAVNNILKEYPHVRVIGVNHVNQRFSELAAYSQKSGMEFEIAYMPRFAREHPGGAPRFYVVAPNLRSVHMTQGYSRKLFREVLDVLDALPTGQ